MKKILLSLLSIGVVAVVAVAATGAFFSDTETSQDNTFVAGSLDLGIDNESFYNGVLNQGTTWTVSYDLSDENGPALGAYLFYNFDDVKPGDFGEDTISVIVSDNDAWACTQTTITSNDDVDCTNSELADDPSCAEPDLDDGDGDLAQEINIMWWADDGDNVFEQDETLLDPIGDLGSVPLDFPVIRKLSDSLGSVFSPTPAPLTGGTTYYIAKAWCFGTLGAAPLAPGAYTGPDVPTNDGVDTTGPATPGDGGISCDGNAVVGNAAQTDKVMLDVSFYAEQSRNNPTFNCANAPFPVPPAPPPVP